MNTRKREPIIKSLMDNDVYKATMMQAVWFLYSNLKVEYNFTNRSQTPFPKGFAAELRWQIKQMGKLRFTEEELNYLSTCPDLAFFKPEFLGQLRDFQLDPNDVIITEVDNGIKIAIRGLWYKTILWEVPILAIISELFYQMTGQPADMEVFQSNLERKVSKMTAAGCRFVEFGTRRRYSQAIQEKVVVYMANFPEYFLGTSNMYLAMKYDLCPKGTVAHEWMMAHMAMFGICEANKKALLAWYQVYEGQLGIALPDTFTTDVFFRDFDADIAKLYTGLRWDSGDPDEFTLKTKAHYESLGLYNPNIPLLYSDGLDDDQSIELQGKWANVFNVAYGIGTFFSNDVGVKPLQIVIKLLYVWIDGERIEVVKLSDTPGKHNGSKTAVAAAKAKLGLT